MLPRVRGKMFSHFSPPVWALRHSPQLDRNTWRNRQRSASIRYDRRNRQWRPPSAITGGMGSGAPPSARKAVLGRGFPRPAAPELQFTCRPASNTNPRHTNRIFVKRMISSSQDSGASERLTVAPALQHGRSLRLAVVSLLRERNLVGIPTRGELSNHKQSDAGRIVTKDRGLNSRETPF
jgi:hypothetical protein